MSQGFNRRGFLTACGAATVAATVPGDKTQSIEPDFHQETARRVWEGSCPSSEGVDAKKLVWDESQGTYVLKCDLTEKEQQEILDALFAAGRTGKLSGKIVVREGVDVLHKLITTRKIPWAKKA